MAVYRSYQCGSCEQKFRWLHHPSDSPPPDNCPLCGASTGEIVDAFIPQAPRIQGVIGIAADQVYRSMEAASEARVEEAMAIAGGDRSDYAHTKITDLNDRQREGDISARMPPASPVQTFMTENARVAPIGSQAAAVAQQYAAAAHTGYFPHAGDRTRQVVSGNMHARLRSQMQAKGQLNK